MTAPDLLPCPFCGGEAQEGFNGGYRVMKCDRCPVEVYAESRKRLVKVWNTRATPAATDPKVTALVEAAERARDYFHGSGPDHPFAIEKLLADALAALREGRPA